MGIIANRRCRPLLVLRLSIRPGRRLPLSARTIRGAGRARLAAASQRKLDPARSKPYRPWHTHDEGWPLRPGEPVELDIEIRPTSIVVPPGYRLGAHGQWQGLRGGWKRHRAAERTLSNEKRRPVPPHRRRRSAGCDFRRSQPCTLPKPVGLTSCTVLPTA